jgi:hypothetical protein
MRLLDQLVAGGIVLAIAAAMTCACVAAEPRPVIIPREKWASFFSGQKATLRFIVQSAEPINGRLIWGYSSQQLSLARNESAVTVQETKSAEVEIMLQLPETREEVVLDTELGLRLLDSRGDVIADYRRILRIFPRDPFANRGDWLRKQKISLYDPEGGTRKIFEEHAIPCETVRNLSVLETKTEGMVIVGEGVSWTERPGLPEVLVKLAVSGVSVLCLAPGEGSMTFPGTDDDRPARTRVTLNGREVISQFDKRLDAQAWPPDGLMIKTGFELAAGRDRVVLTATESQRGWPWMEVEYPEDGRLILCGLGIVRAWDVSPVPRYLLLSILESLSQQKQSNPSTTAKE